MICLNPHTSVVKLDKQGLLSELQLKAVRSSGSGGQHVNKVSTKVELSFHLQNSKFLSDEQKQRLGEIYAKRLTKEGLLMLSADATRSQLRNKELVIKRFFELLEAGLKPRKKRKPTSVSKAAKKRRLEQKRRQADKKANRKPPSLD